jgi:phosphatidylinositol kinase/protein kinase (PI-3  family)
MVDAMGVLGFEGPFRRTMEVCMQSLRLNKDTLIGVLEPFIRDPTVAWGRGGRAQQRLESLHRGSELASVSKGHTVGGFQDTENKDADEVIQFISGRLSGIYNIRHPRASKIIGWYRSQSRLIPRIGLAASQEDELCLPLSIEGQVDRLITEAVSELNLAQMYHGIRKFN